MTGAPPPEEDAMNRPPKKKLIEVALPLEAINKESLHRKQKAPKGWPTSFHKWWAQRPLAAARAVIFAQMVDDPSSYPDLFPTEKKQEKERQRLFGVIEELVQWENTTNDAVLERARAEIWQSWRRSCAENVEHPLAKELFDRHSLPAFADPFAGSGSIPLSAQWLGLEAHASDLNPVAVLINKALIEVPALFSQRAPVNQEARGERTLLAREWKGAQGLAEDVRHYAEWMRSEAHKRIGRHYPSILVTAEMAVDRPDLAPYVGRTLTAIAWLWARTVKSPDPAFASVDVPLASTFMLSTKSGKEAYVEPIISDGDYHFTVRVGRARDASAARDGTKLGRGANFRCVMSGTPIDGDYIKAEGCAGRMGTRLMAIVAEGHRGRIYLSPTPEHEAAALNLTTEWRPEVTISGSTQYLGVKPYGMDRFDQLFTDRQIISLQCFSALVGEAISLVRRDAVAAGVVDDDIPLRDGGVGARAYAEAVALYLACVVDRMAYYGSTLTTWLPKDNALRDCMPRQALAMTWDFAEGNPLAKSSGDVITCSKVVYSYLSLFNSSVPAHATQRDARVSDGHARHFVVSTDPPYYDNVPYADLSDFFYVWLRQSLRSVFPESFATVAVPKSEELVAFAHRHQDRKAGAEAFFLDGMTRVMRRLVEEAHPEFPVTIYYAFKQAEDDEGGGTASTGWETFLSAVVLAGFCVSGTWPMRTEGEGRMRASESNALASSIVLVCRPRLASAATATRREFLAALKSELPGALVQLQKANIAPVDLAQAAIGPGMAIYTRYRSVLDAEGQPLGVREALALINQILDAVLAEQEGDFDADSRWALTWFEQSGFSEGEYGVAEQLSKSKNTSVGGMVEAGILESKRGKVRLLRPEELPEDWDPSADPRLTAWEIVHHLIRALASGEAAAAELVAKLGSKAEVARELAYRLYSLCERKKRAAEALAYNGLVQSFPEITRLARDTAQVQSRQTDLFEREE